MPYKKRDNTCLAHMRAQSANPKTTLKHGLLCEPLGFTNERHTSQKHRGREPHPAFPLFSGRGTLNQQDLKRSTSALRRMARSICAPRHPQSSPTTHPTQLQINAVDPDDAPSAHRWGSRRPAAARGLPPSPLGGTPPPSPPAATSAASAASGDADAARSRGGKIFT